MAKARNTAIKKWKEMARRAFDERARLYTDRELRQFEKHSYNRTYDQRTGAVDTNLSARTVLNIPLVSVMLRRLVATVYFRDPKIMVRSYSQEGDWAVPIITRLWNTKIPELGLKRQMRMAIQDTFTCGWSFLKLGYDAEFAIDAAAKLESENEWQLTPPQELRKENRIAKGSPWWLRVHPADVALEPGARDMESARWAVHRYFRRVDELKADDRFSNTRDLKPDIDLSIANSQLTQAYQGDLASPVNKNEAIVLLYEIRDLTTGKMMVTPANQKDRWLFNEDDEITNLTDRLPFYPVIFNPLSKSPYGTSTVDLLDKPQMEFNDIRTQDMKQRRISILKILMAEGFMEDEEIENLTSEDVGAVVKVKGGISPEKLQQFMTHQGFDMQVAAENVRRDMRELSGLGRVQMGEAASGRHTATESAQVQVAHDLMTENYRNIVADVILELVRDAHKLIAGTPAVQGFWTDERIIDMVAELGARRPVPFKGTDLIGSFGFEILSDSSPPPSRTQIKSERAAVASHLANHPRVNQDYLLRWAVQPFEDLDAERLIIPDKQFTEATKQTLAAQQQQAQQQAQGEAAQEAAGKEQDLDNDMARMAAQAAIDNKGQEE